MTERRKRYIKLYELIENDSFLMDDRNGNETLIGYLYNVKDLQDIEKIALSDEWESLYIEVIIDFVFDYLRMVKKLNWSNYLPYINGAEIRIETIVNKVIYDFEGLLIHTGAELKEHIDRYTIELIEEC